MPPKRAPAKAGKAKATLAGVNGIKDGPTTKSPAEVIPPQSHVPNKKGRASVKRGRNEPEDEPTEAQTTRKKPRSATPERVVKPIARQPPALNTRPSRKLDIFVFGSGSFGELGLGHKKHKGESPDEVARPRLNHNLLAEKVGVVQVACGGMHAIALTADNKVLTWGVNDDKALGRESSWGEDSEDDGESDSGLDAAESTPGEVDLSIAGGSQFVRVAATDSASFVLTEDGLVYGWGSFRGADGILGFTGDVDMQPTPIHIPGLKDITSLAAGSNHMLALDKDGKVWSWGSGSHLQLGRRPMVRRGGPRATLIPALCGHFTKRNYAVKIGAGSFHSFCIDNNGTVWSWGLNNFSQTGHAYGSGNTDSLVATPTKVTDLSNIVHIDGGEHHSAACSANGELLTWGRIDSHQVGISEDLFDDENTIFDDRGRARILYKPTVVPDLNVSFVATGTSTTIAITSDGKAYSWGFSESWQTGLGTKDDVPVPTLIDPRDVLNKKLIWAGSGGQYSMLAAAH
ncbi:RCC1/BLIP-II [Whalleya microplaca]|nr:RCC1/BLIP-II [Whalleya microplaca]